MGDIPKPYICLQIAMQTPIDIIYDNYTQAFMVPK